MGRIGYKHCKCGMRNNKNTIKTRKKQWETSNFFSLEQKCQQSKHVREGFAGCKLAQHSQRAPCKNPSYEGSSGKTNNMWTFNGFSCFIVIFITWSHSCFLSSASFSNTEGLEHICIFQTSLTIGTPICFREMGPEDSSTGRSATSKKTSGVWRRVCSRRSRRELLIFGDAAMLTEG